MKKTGNDIASAFIILALLLLFRVIPIFAPDTRLWGINHLIFLPGGLQIAFCLIWLAALVFPALKKSANPGESLSLGFVRLFYEGTQRIPVRALVTTAMIAIFILFLAPTHFLGDGYDLLGTLGTSARSIIKGSEMGASYIVLGLQSLLGGISRDNALAAFQIVSVTAGAVTIWFFFLIAGVISADAAGRLLTFMAALGSGALLLFFGYVETYPLLWPAAAGFIYFGLRYISTGKGLFWPLVFLLFGLFIHFQSIVMLPAYGYLLLCRGTGLHVYRRLKKWIWLMAGVIALAAVFLFLYKYSSDLFFKDAFLPLFKGKPIDPSYAAISIAHFFDMVNELLLVSPLLVLFGFPALLNVRKTFKNPAATFLAVVAAGHLLFLLGIDPKLAMPRDWDLFALSGFTLTLAALALIDGEQLSSLKRLLVPIAIILLTAPLPYLITNLSDLKSKRYAEYIMNTDIPRSMSTLVVLYDYYRQAGETSKADRLKRLFGARYPDKINIDRAFEAINSGDVEQTKRLLRKITPDEYNFNFHKLMAFVFTRAGKYDKALDAIDKSLQLKPYNYDLHKSRALIFLKSEQYDNALVALRRAYRFKADDEDIIQTMATVYFVTKKYDSMLVYSSKLMELNPVNVNGMYFLAESYYGLGQYDRMRERVEIYRENGRNDPLYESRTGALDSLLRETVIK
ncbi:MAG: hypothetical protein JSV44_12645 [Candidatus Zixiibacteriota bacterium]|nr:MAG: hypothetical protein JSV44_12645 [candidate division Zixibacteria bacterium]